MKSDSEVVGEDSVSEDSLLLGSVDGVGLGSNMAGESENRRLCCVVGSVV